MPGVEMGQLYLAKAVEAYERGVNAAECGDVERAMACFADALRMQPNHVEAMIAQGNFSLQQGDLDTAVRLLEEAVRLAPSDPIALGSLGIAYYSQGDLDRALGSWDRVIRENPDLPVEIAMMLAQVLLEAGAPERARDLLARLVERAPQSPEARTLLATALFEMAEYVDARTETKRALALDENWAAAHHLRGLIALQLGEMDIAVQSFVRERELNPDSPQGATMLAVTVLQLGQRDRALAMINAVLQRGDLDADTLITCAQVYVNADLPDVAIGLLQEVLTADSTDDDAVLLLLEIAARTKDFALLQWLRDEIAGEDDDLLQAIAACEQAIGPAPKKGGKAKQTPQIAYQLRLELTGLRPPIWRRVLVSGDTTLAELHQSIQAVMDWHDCHLHEFEALDTQYADPRAELEEARDERKVTLAQLGLREKDRLHYVYDFGDNWEMLITVMRMLPYDPAATYPTCITGKRAAPPEDCGGPWMYADLLDMREDPDHPERDDYADLLDEWAADSFDPEVFDITRANARLQKVRPAKKR